MDRLFMIVLNDLVVIIFLLSTNQRKIDFAGIMFFAIIVFFNSVKNWIILSDKIDENMKKTWTSSKN